MSTQLETMIAQYRKKLHLLQHALKILESKTLYLIESNLSQLEKSLEEETWLVQQLSQLEESWEPSLGNSLDGSVKAGSRKVEAQLSEAGSAELVETRLKLLDVVEKIRVVKCRNLALVENGLQFCNTVLNAIYPPRTYDPSASLGSSMPAKSLVSVEG